MISIFAKRAFLNINPSFEYVDTGVNPKRGHLMRVSSIIRGDQIAKELGAKLNPIQDYENDVCIYVKPHIKKDNMNFKFEGKKSYLDIIDGHNLGQLMIKYPKVGVIVCSEVDKETLSTLIPNKIVLIPQHHCNFENKLHKGIDVKKVGIIGEIPAFDHLPNYFEEELNKMGIELVKFSQFFRREDITKFYMDIDLQLVWRPYKKLLSNPLKIVNASSFGVPTVALEEPAFKEVSGCYKGVNSIDEALGAIKSFKEDFGLYGFFRSNCLSISSKYHIKEIAKMYLSLDK